MTFSRRSFLSRAIGGFAAGAVVGAAERRVRAGDEPGITPARACVLVFLHGGASHIDTFDPKPDAPEGGPFRPIATALDGVQISEHLPGLAERMSQMALIRSVTSREGNHDRARYLMHTGFVRQGGVTHPGLGSHVDRRRRSILPGYVAVDSAGQPPGYLGAEHAAFAVNDAGKPVRNLAPPGDLPEGRFGRRVDLRARLDARFARTRTVPQVEGLRAVADRAVAMHGNPDVVAFDLDQETAADRARYGEERFGSACLMARRLVDVGVPFVEINSKGWDTHADAFPTIEQNSRELDRGLSALLDDLRSSGRYDETLVIVMGDFGRTPRINARGGRDHHPDASSVLLGGGPIVRGTLIGSTDERGDQVTRDPVRVADLFASFAAALGVVGDETHVTPEGRPVTTVDAEGEVVRALFA